MDWSKIETMDPDLLVGIVNTALRNHYTTLQELCRANSVDQEALLKRLAEGDYEYLKEQNRFR